MLIQVIRIGGAWPVHEIQVDVIRAQRLQGRVNALSNTLMPWVIKLSRQPDLLSWDSGIFDPASNFGLVAICKSGIDVSVSFSQGNFHSLLNLVRPGLPSTQANSWDFGARVELEFLSRRRIV